MHLLAVLAFDFDPGDQLTGGGTSLKGHAGDGRRFGFYHRTDILNLQNRRSSLSVTSEIGKR